MYISNFERVEEKYYLTKGMKQEFLKRINEHIEKDKYFESNIHNIYLDTKDSELIVNCMEKPIFRNKFRIRSYGVPQLTDNIFIEIKMKYKGVVGKRRTIAKLQDFYDFIDGKIDSLQQNNVKDQILNEFEYFYNYYNLKPVIYIAYDRESYKGKNDKSLRITFDTNLRSRTNNLRLENPSNTTNFFDEKCYLMEIKMIGSLPLWLVKILSDMEMLPISFSKYGKIYEKNYKLQNKKKESVKYA